MTSDRHSTDAPGPRDVTLYIPARDSARTLNAVIESARSQSVSPTETILVVDTRSRDATADIALRSGLRVIEQTEGLLGHARNLALSACETRWLASVDSDVTLSPDWLQNLLRAARRECPGRTLAAVGGRTEEALHTHADRWRGVNLPHNWGPLPLDDPFMLVSEMLANVAALQAIGGYRPDLFYYDDSDLCQRLRHAGFTLRYEPGAVARHDRRDSVSGVLDLRWKYAAYRQRERFDALPGLIAKFAVNRAYCLQGLSQTLHSEHAEVCAISLLLWFHHARRDLAEALGKWPLLAPEQRAVCMLRLDAATTGELHGRWDELLPLMRALLESETSAAQSVGDFGGDGAARRFAFDRLHGFEDYLARARAATRELLHEIPYSLAREIIHSARLLSGDAGAGFDARAARTPPHGWSDSRLNRRIDRAAWDWSTLAPIIQRQLSEAGAPASEQNRTIRMVGPTLPVERPADAAGACRTDAEHAALVLLPHLEAFVDPRGELGRALARADAAAIAYQTPTAFAPHVPILQPRDLAECCARAGWEIRHFHTEAGLTRMLLRRLMSPKADVRRRCESAAAALVGNAVL